MPASILKSLSVGDSPLSCTQTHPVRTISQSHSRGREIILTQKLREQLHSREEQDRLITPAHPKTISHMADFGSNDTLSFSSSGVLRTAFLKELERHPNFTLGSRSTRIFEGTTQYLTDLEEYLAHFHGAESALFFNSGFDANVALWSTVPQPGDVVLYDQYVHASIHEGMRRGRAETQMFPHNDCAGLQQCLLNLREKHPGIAEGNQTVFIALESVYSMDADSPPIHRMIQLVKEILPRGNAVLSIDEAHSNGLLGPNGSGYACSLGLEKEFALRLHTCGKGLGATGGVILANKIIRSYIINYAKNVIFSTGPAFPVLAAVKAGYDLLASEEGETRRTRLQQNISYFHNKLTSHPHWSAIKQNGILTIPTEGTWATESFHAPIIPFNTRDGDANSLADRLHQAHYWVNPVHYPLVPKGQERVRLVLHADNTESQIDDILGVIMQWSMEQVRDSTRFDDTGWMQVACSI
ncbi:PLP-dependent transferase [Aspergillus sclerotioniger CBS 115572]|uniref:PLP-dependent transferase n=1 Tax=Aspergillus sclerotioniger CBS 115572 TaxID=1450535 RepID=A0A317V4B4_9EURO|nr:PLP-dependent transferase [Aspergillus sclerotioniger CBS 115572]PWY67642.1 PLP-dependent transferase [Aspergillus sclerotioniger CBS 115572]